MKLFLSIMAVMLLAAGCALNKGNNGALTKQCPPDWHAQAGDPVFAPDVLAPGIPVEAWPAVTIMDVPPSPSAELPPDGHPKQAEPPSSLALDWVIWSYVYLAVAYILFELILFRRCRKCWRDCPPGMRHWIDHKKGKGK